MSYKDFIRGLTFFFLSIFAIYILGSVVGGFNSFDWPADSKVLYLAVSFIVGFISFCIGACND